MNFLESAKENLFQFTKLESFQKDYYNKHLVCYKFVPTQQNKIILDEHFNSVGHTVLKENYVTSLRLSDENFELPESHFFNDVDDVRITKHPRYSFPIMHLHSFFEVLFVFSGQCINVIDGKNLIFSGGDLCIIPPKVEHSVYVKDDETIVLNILIKISTFDQVFTTLLKSSNILSVFFNEILYSNQFHKYLVCSTGNDEILKEIILRMFQACEGKGQYYSEIMNGYFAVFVGTLLQHHEDHVKYPPGYFDKYSEVSQMLNYILVNSTHITLKDCAKKFHFSERYLSLILKKHTGKSFSQLVTSAKIEMAKELLRYNHVNLAILAEKAGYKDPAYFTKVFKRETGCTPTIYKNQFSPAP